MFRGLPIRFIVCVALIPVGIGIFILLVWWLRRRFIAYTITDHRTIARTGAFIQSTKEVRHMDIQNIRISQNFLQRKFGSGSVTILGAGQSDSKLVMVGVMNPQGIISLIRKYQDKS